MTFLNAVLLFGLAAVAIPPIIHLLNRRRFDVVDWAAMQFLLVSQRTRRKIFLEELLLMLLRMLLIAVLVAALAAPTLLVSGWLSQLFENKFFNRLGLDPREPRQVVILIDGSASMAYADAGKKTPYDAARAWAEQYLDLLSAADKAAVMVVKQQVVPVFGAHSADEPLPSDLEQLLSSDREQIKAGLARLRQPRGGANWPGAFQAAFRVLGDRKQGPRELIVLTDNQKQSWADEASIARWEILAQQHAAEAGDPPRIWVVNLAGDRPLQPANWSLSLPKVSRAVAAARQTISFRTALQRLGSGDRQAPERVRCELDGRPAGESRPPATALAQGQYPLSFKVKIDAPGFHLVSIALDKVGLPGENRRDYAIEVLKELPILLVDGDTRPSPPRRGTDFLRRALSPKNDPAPSVRAAVVDVEHFTAESLTRDVGEEPGSAPRVLVLCNVARLTAGQQEAVERFLSAGGSVLVTLGPRVEAKAYNEQLHREGKGWLPVKLGEPVGDESNVIGAQRPNPATFGHPALEMFRETNEGGLADVRFPRYWKMGVSPESRATPIARLVNNDPWLVEMPYHSGRVMVAAVPLDDSWRTNLVGSQTPAFVPLCHELIFYLAGARGAELNLQPGQPIRFRPPGDEPPGPVTVQPPEGPAKTVSAVAWPALWEETREPGVYKLTSARGQAGYFVVQSDPLEADLAPNSESDRLKVKELVPGLTYAEEQTPEAALASQPAQNVELWWLLMAGVIALLAGEIWLTRRVALKQ